MVPFVLGDTKKATVNLPKIVEKKFIGKPTAWQEFCDTFQATVGRRTDFTGVEKFTYLKGYLGERLNDVSQVSH